MEDACFPGLSSDNSSGWRESDRILIPASGQLRPAGEGDPEGGTLLLSRLSTKLVTEAGVEKGVPSEDGHFDYLSALLIRSSGMRISRFCVLLNPLSFFIKSSEPLSS